MIFRRARFAVAASLACLAAWSSPAFAQFTDKTTTTPVLIQDNFGPVGSSLPYNGVSYCFPMSGAMGLRLGLVWGLTADQGDVVVETRMADAEILAKKGALGHERMREVWRPGARAERLVIGLVLQHDDEDVMDR